VPFDSEHCVLCLHTREEGRDQKLRILAHGRTRWFGDRSDIAWFDLINCQWEQLRSFLDEKCQSNVAIRRFDFDYSIKSGRLIPAMNALSLTWISYRGRLVHSSHSRSIEFAGLLVQMIVLLLSPLHASSSS